MGVAVSYERGVSRAGGVLCSGWDSVRSWHISGVTLHRLYGATKLVPWSTLNPQAGWAADNAHQGKPRQLERGRGLHHQDQRGQGCVSPVLCCEKTFNLKLSGNEVYYTA